MTTELLEPESQIATVAATETAPNSARKQRMIEWLPPVLFAVTLIFQLARLWRKSFDPIIDFGRELYTPWQIAQGKSLYTEIAAFYGPLSQYINALAFRLFGSTLTTLLAVNFAVIAVATTLLYLLLRQVTTMLAATVGTLLFIAMFGTAHVGAVGNFNFLTPYSHEATHGITLSLGAMLAFTRFARTHKTSTLAIAAFVAGCVIMTKPEIAVALFGALAVGFALHVRSTGFSLKADDQAKACTPYTIALAAGAFALPLVLMTVFLATKSPFSDAIKQTFGAWLFVSNGSLLQSRFYANSMGLENPAGQVTLIFTTALRFAAILVPPLLAALFIKHRVLSGVVGAALALLAGTAMGLQWWMYGSEILLLATLLIAASQIPSVLNPRKIPLLIMTAFSLLILLKMLLHTRFHQYGFILAIVPTMLLTIALLDMIPAWLARRNANRWTFRIPALAVLGMLAVVSLTISTWNLAEQKHVVHAGSNSFYTDDRAPVLADAIAFMQRNTKPADTLTVLPEGLMLNVLADRQTSIPYLSALPSDITMFTEEKILAALEKGPPAFIAITHRPASDFGQASFGVDYALTLRSFITQRYHPVHLSGAVPYTSDNFGILILQRNP